MGFILKRKNKGNKEDVLKSKRDIVLAEFMIEQHYRIFTDSLKLLQTTTNPRTFFGRYDDMLGAVGKIMEACKKVNLESSELKGLEIVEDITSEEVKTNMIIDFIDRCIDVDKVEVLEAELGEYKDKMTEESISYYIEKIGDL